MTSHLAKLSKKTDKFMKYNVFPQIAPAVACVTPPPLLDAWGQQQQQHQAVLPGDEQQSMLTGAACLPYTTRSRQEILDN